MQKTTFYLFFLLFITACQVVKMPKKPLKAEQVALAYFLDSLVPNDPHLEGREFEFDFVVRQGIGNRGFSAYAKAFRYNDVIRCIPEETHYLYSVNPKEYRAPLRMKRISKIKRMKYENNINDFIYSFVPVSSILDTNKIDFTKKKKGEIYLGSKYTELPNGALYTSTRLQVIYVYRGLLQEKSYYFILRNGILKGLTCYSTNHTIPPDEGKIKHLIKPC